MRLTRREAMALGAGGMLSAEALSARAAAASDRIYDAHVHLFTDDIERYPLDTSGAREGAEQLSARIRAHPITAERMLSLWTANGVQGGAAVQYSSAYKTDNRYLLDSVGAHSGRLAGVIILNATDKETPATLRTMVATQGVHSLRMTGFADASGTFPWLDSDAALATWDTANALGLVVVLMALPPGVSTNFLGRCNRLAQRFPRCRIVLDHVGWAGGAGPPADDLTPAHLNLRTRRNIFFKVTTINLDILAAARRPAAGFVRRLADVYGAEKLMWGSDFGNSPGDYADMVRRGTQAMAMLSARERRAILDETARRLFSHP